MSSELEQQAEQALRAASSPHSHGRFADLMTALERLAASGARFAEMRDFASRTAPLFAAATQEIAGWRTVWFEGIYGGGEEEALRSLHRRTQIEYARELYAGTAAEQLFADFGDDELDRDLRERAECHAHDAPAYVPRTHTWWRFDV